MKKNKTAKCGRRKPQERLSQAAALSAATCIGLGTTSWGQDAPAATMPEVVVTGQQQKSYRPEASALPKYTQPLLDTPQSISVVPQQVIQDQNATTLRDALRNVPGISLAAGEAGAQGDSLTIRGFTARNDIFVDGMRDFGSYYRDSFNLEQAEVLKGPASVAFGRGSTGGVVNQVSKTPHLDAYNEGTLTFGTDKTKRITADINQPLPELSDTSAFRMTLMGNKNEVAGRDVAENDRFGFAPSLAYGIGTADRLSLTYFHQTENDVPDYGLPYYFSHRPPVDRDNFYGFEDHNYFKADADIGTVKAEHDFSDSLSVRDQARYARYKRSIQVTEPQVPATVTPATPLSAVQVVRNQIAVDGIETYAVNQLDFTGKVKTGPIDHTIVSGIEVGQETSDPERTTYTGVPTTSLLSPNSNQPFVDTGASITSRIHTIAHTLGLYLLDTLKFGEHLEATGGVRWDRFSADYSQSIAPVASFSRVDQMTSWRGSLVYKPVPIGSFYVSYGTSFNPSAEMLSLSAANANVDPEKNRTYEMGSKWDLFQKRITLTGAIFRDEKTNARTIDPTNPLLNVLAGDQRVDGFELGAAGRVTEKWQVLAGYAFMQGKIVSSNNPLEVGNPIPNAPKHTANFWTTYDLPKRMQVGAGANAVSLRTGRTTPDASTGQIESVPGYVTFDAMFKMPLTNKINLQLNLYNIADSYYFDTVHPAHIIPGAGRTLLVSTSFDF